MARRADHSREELHEMIVSTAYEIISSEGIEKLSARSIAKNIGYSPGTLYQHFKDINDIVLHVNARIMQMLVMELEQVRNSNMKDPRKSIHLYADTYLNFIQKNANAWNAMFAYKRSGPDDIPEWYEKQINILIAMVEENFKKIKDGKKSGISANKAARMLWASVHGLVTLASGGRLQVIINEELDAATHKIIDIHINAFDSK